jgi:hypothetical protein
MRYEILVHTNPNPAIDPRFQASLETETHWIPGPMRVTKEEAETGLERMLEAELQP